MQITENFIRICTLNRRDNSLRRAVWEECVCYKPVDKLKLMFIYTYIIEDIKFPIEQVQRTFFFNASAYTKSCFS